MRFSLISACTFMRGDTVIYTYSECKLFNKNFDKVHSCNLPPVQIAPLSPTLLFHVLTHILIYYSYWLAFQGLQNYSWKAYATSFFLYPYQLSAPVKICPWAICAKRRKCACTGEGKCVNTICFHKNRIWRKRESGEGGKKDKSERLFCHQLQSDIY